MSMVLVSLEDISGDGANHALGVAVTNSKWVQFNAPDANVGAATRIGDTNISGTRGHPMIANATLMLPPVAGNTYDHTGVFYRIPSGDKLNCIYAI